MVYNTIIALHRAGIDRNIQLTWTRAHVGTAGNERADEGAKKGSTLDIKIPAGIPKAETKGKIKEYFYKEWSTEWEKYSKARMMKLFYGKPDENQAKYVLKLGRLELSRFIKLVTGHNGLFYFMNKVDPDINAICRFCLEEDETFYHLATECPALRQKQIEIFLDKLPITNTKWSVRDLLHFSYLPGICDAIEGSTSPDERGEDHNWDSSDVSATETE